jgi:elongation factor 1 alpha-like protein
MEAIDAFELPARDVTGNFRLAVQDVFKDLGHVKVSGRIESGSIQVGDSVLVLPIKETSLVKRIPT